MKQTVYRPIKASERLPEDGWEGFLLYKEGDMHATGKFYHKEGFEPLIYDGEYDNPISYYSHWLEEIEIDIPEQKKRFTWEDLRDGKCAVEMPKEIFAETIVLLQDLILESFEVSNAPSGLSKFYYRSEINKKTWTGTDYAPNLPSQPLSDFFPLD